MASPLSFVVLFLLIDILKKVFGGFTWVSKRRMLREKYSQF